jgi:hypothetical protein
MTRPRPWRYGWRLRRRCCTRRIARRVVDSFGITEVPPQEVMSAGSGDLLLARDLHDVVKTRICWRNPHRERPSSDRRTMLRLGNRGVRQGSAPSGQSLRQLRCTAAPNKSCGRASGECCRYRTASTQTRPKAATSRGPSHQRESHPHGVP